MVLSQKMKLLHITTVPMSLRFLRGQVSYMQGRGFRVDVLSSPGVLLTDFAAQESTGAHAVEMPRRISPLQDIAAAWRILRVIRQVRPHIVHAHTPKGGLLGMIAAWLARVPVRVYHLRGLPFVTATGYHRVLLRTTERISCSLAHCVICMSPSLREEALQAKVCSSEKLVVLCNGGNGVDAESLFNPSRPHLSPSIREQLGIPAHACVIGFVGRLVRDKGVIELAEAWSQVRASVPDAHLLIIGDPEPRDPVPESVLAHLQSDSRVHMPGFVANLADMPPYYRAMDMLVLPTYREGFPNTPLEASAMGLPVVATRVTGCVDAVVDGVTGTLVPVRDSAALAQAIRAYLDDPDLRRRHGSAGRERALREFRPEAIWAAIHENYIALLR
jgi:glycosyltransferase involved in cell wall biosynthesis